ncbi:16769_t:CDS:2 [Funneliformis geosporum]|uniref:16769_t:CDS:1 n=1 Tax=Funneliformis geosporum TaxID=1117311 RepID=A0A9W4T2D2_9GLOM|nr:16769_t:CDS:2 [Funneliformis geosporum]
MDSTHASSSTSTRTSPLTSSADLVALSQELSRLDTIFNEQEFTQKEKAELRKFFTVEATQRKDILDLISTLTNDREKLNYLKEFLTEVSKKITDAFPGGLPYVKPEPLLYTSGSNWEYQPDPSLKQILRRELKSHYENFILGRFDKLNLPIYLFLSGAGTGKSRNANEFHQTAITCLSAQEDDELLARIKEAWVFLVSYENGFALRSDESHPYLAIGTRMLFQLLREKMRLHEIIETYKPPDPLDVVSVIAKHHNRDLKNVTVILVVDGMQQLMENKDDGLKLNSQFYKTLTSVADLAFSGIFVIPVCTSTITGPIDGTLRYSPRKRIYLPVTSLQSPSYRQGDSLVPVFKNDEITNTLVEDCGGHGRALEVLNDCLAGRNVEECNVNTLMNDLRYNLIEKYRDAILGSVEDARPIARVILTRRILNRYKPIPKTNKTPDEFVGSGLIRFEQLSRNSRRGYITAPYIWLWIFVEISNEEGDPLLRDWEFADYVEQRALLNPVTSLQAKSWQSFENFVASFRCIMSAVIEEDELTTISEIHAGARLNGDIQFKNHNLRLEIAKHHTDTKSKSLTASEWSVDCYNSTVDVRQFKHCIINAPASPYGDSFLSLDQPGTESPNEIYQFKLRKKAVSKKEYQEEREKSASKNDFFILFTTANCNIEIPKRSGIIDRNAFTNYFGPFAGRAYRSAMANPPIYNNKVKNIHTVSLGQICIMNQISKERVNSKTKIPMKNFYFRKGLHMISRILPRLM